MTGTPMNRKLLGEFLKNRRERITPTIVGLPAGRRRRTPGLRREELAQLAGVSVAWYTWIEQGREINFSVDVLESLARVLQLSPHERAYLFSLAGKPLDENQPTAQETIPPRLQHILDHQGAYPAYIMGRFWNMLAWNEAAVHLLGDFAAMPAQERNVIWYMFMRPATRQLITHWEDRAQRLIAEFRADCSAYLTDPWLMSYLDHIRAGSAEFDHWWQRQDVQVRDGGRREFNHPQVGELVLEQTTFRLSNAPDIKLVLHIPADEATGEKLLSMC